MERTPDVFDLNKIGLSLYVHIPWCLKKCPYCDFNSHALPKQVDFAAYTDALIADAQAQAVLVPNRKIASVFLGGGTPSLFPIHEYQRLFTALRELFLFDEECEITLEANPATLEHAPFEQYLALGINRLSLGAQSFDDEALAGLGRVHRAKQAKEALMLAKQAGFGRINVDIMHGLPNQTTKGALYDLQCALEHGATHLSWYQLTIEPNTAFYQNPPTLPTESVLEDIEMQGTALLKSYGFRRYEVSAWVGSNDSPCRHNVNYWRFGDYLAIGAGAHGKITLLRQQLQENSLAWLGVCDAKQGVYRFKKSRSPKDYLNYQVFPKFVDFGRIDDNELASEFMMNALRLVDGVSVETFEASTGLWVSTIDNELIPLQHQGLMVFKPTRLAPTALGFRYVNHLVQAFLR